VRFDIDITIDDMDSSDVNNTRHEGKDVFTSAYKYKPKNAEATTQLFNLLNSK